MTNKSSLFARFHLVFVPSGVHTLFQKYNQYELWEASNSQLSLSRIPKKESYFSDSSFLNVNIFLLLSSSVICKLKKSGERQNKTFEDIMLGFEIMMTNTLHQFLSNQWTHYTTVKIIVILVPTRAARYWKKLTLRLFLTLRYILRYEKIQEFSSDDLNSTLFYAAFQNDEHLYVIWAHSCVLAVLSQNFHSPTGLLSFLKIKSV